MFHGFWLSALVLSALVLPVLVNLLTWPLLRSRPVKGTLYPPGPSGIQGQ